MNITPKGVDDVEGRPQEATPITNFIFNAPVYSSVIGTHNPAELINNFDLSSIEERTEREGDADAEEPREALAVRYVISLKKAKRWIVAPCSVFENCHGFGRHRQVWPSIAPGRQIGGFPKNGNLYFRGSTFPVV